MVWQGEVGLGEQTGRQILLEGEGLSRSRGAGVEGKGTSWLTAVLPQNTLIQELESSQRQIEEQHHHKVPSCWPALPAWEG